MKISEMPIPFELGDNDLIPIVQDGVNKAIPLFYLSPDDNFLLSIWNWSGTTTVSNGSFLNYFSLAGITAALNTADTQIDPVSKALKFPPYEKPSQVQFTIRMTGTIGGAAGQAREWRQQLRRLDATTVVSSVADLKIDGAPIVNRDVTINSYTNTVDDPFHLDGILAGLFNNSGQTITITGLSIRVQRHANPE